MSLKKIIFFFSIIYVLTIPHASFSAASKTTTEKKISASEKKKTTVAEKKKTSPIVLNTAVRYETHDTNMTEDFSYLYTIFSASAKLPNKSIATIHYLTKHNQDDEINHSNVFGVSFVKIIDDKTWVTVGYSSENEFFDLGDKIENKAAKISASTSLPINDNTKHIFELGYSAANGDFQRRTPSFSYEFDYKLNENLKGNLSYLYSKASYDYPSLNVTPTLTTNRLGAALFAALKSKDKLSIEYLRGDRSFSYYFKTDVTENILRATYQKTY